MFEACASCNTDLDEDTIVSQLESADILCKTCADGFIAFMGDEEIAYRDIPLSKIHSDWRL